MPPRRLSLTEYAAHRGVTKSAVSQAIARGRLTEWSCRWTPRRGRWAIDVVKADEEWRRYTFEDWGGRRPAAPSR
jgi:hypothetical protein